MHFDYPLVYAYAYAGCPRLLKFLKNPFPVLPFSDPWKCFQGVEKGCIGKEWVKKQNFSKKILKSPKFCRKWSGPIDFEIKAPWTTFLDAFWHIVTCFSQLNFYWNIFKYFKFPSFFLMYGEKYPKRCKISPKYPELSRNSENPVISKSLWGCWSSWIKHWTWQ